MKKETNILIIEESYILRVGLLAILENNNTIHVEHYSVGCDLQPILMKMLPQVVMASPQFFERNEKQIESLKTIQHFKTVGLIYTYVDPDRLTKFDATIYLNDKQENIQSTINELLNMQPAVPATSKSNDTLSKREKEILKLIVSGNKTKEIADTLFISAHTVNAHRKNIMRKLDIKTVSGLTIYAVLNNIISLNDV